MFVKDPSSRMVINTDDSYYNTVVALRKGAKSEENMIEQINSLQSELSDIKKLLQQVLDGKNYG
jgi:hypothetical protein